MIKGVKFPDILKHENQDYPIVDSNDIKGIYVTEEVFGSFDTLEITSERRKIGFIVSSKDGIYQYVGDDVIDENWSKTTNWRNIQSSLADNVIKVYNTASIIESSCGNTETFVACKSTNKIYVYVANASEFEDSDSVIKTKDGGVSRYVDISLFGLSNFFLLRTNNLSDVNDRQQSLNNLTNSSEEESGKYLYVDESGNVVFHTLPKPMELKGRVDTVDDLPTDAKKGDVYLVGLEGSEKFDEYVCIDDDPIKWECLGKAKSDSLWFKDTNSSFETSAKLLLQGYVDGEDTVAVLGENSSVMTSQNITVAVDSENITIESSKAISVKDSRNVTFESSHDISIEHLDNSSFLSTNVSIAGISSGSGSGGTYGESVSTKNILVGASSSVSNVSNYDIRANVIDSVILANSFNIESGLSLKIGASDYNSKDNVILGNAFDGGLYYNGDRIVFLGNKLINDGKIWMDSYDEQEGNVFISSIFDGSSFSSNVNDGIKNGAVVNSYIQGGIGFSGEFNGLYHTKASNIGINGYYNTVENSKMTGGLFGNVSDNGPQYNKIMSSNIFGGTEKFSYSTVQASEFAGMYSNEYVKYISILSSKVQSGSIAIYDNDSAQNILIGASNLSGYTFGYNNKIAKYSTILGSEASGIYLGGNYNNVISSYGASVLDGYYNTLIGNSSGGDNLIGNNNTSISCISGVVVNGSNDVVMSSTGLTINATSSVTVASAGSRLDGIYNTLISDNGSYIKGSNNISMSSVGLSLIDENASYSLVGMSGSVNIYGGMFNSIISSASCNISGTESDSETITYPSNVSMISCSGRTGTKSYTLYTNNLDANEIFEGNVTLSEKYAKAEFATQSEIEEICKI